jgi:hypothetical protein
LLACDHAARTPALPGDGYGHLLHDHLCAASRRGSARLGAVVLRRRNPADTYCRADPGQVFTNDAPGTNPDVPLGVDPGLDPVTGAG